MRRASARLAARLAARRARSGAYGKRPYCLSSIPGYSMDLYSLGEALDQNFPGDITVAGVVVPFDMVFPREGCR